MKRVFIGVLAAVMSFGAMADSVHDVLDGSILTDHAYAVKMDSEKLAYESGKATESIKLDYDKCNFHMNTLSQVGGVFDSGDGGEDINPESTVFRNIVRIEEIQTRYAIDECLKVITDPDLKAKFTANMTQAHALFLKVMKRENIKTLG